MHRRTCAWPSSPQRRTTTPQANTFTRMTYRRGRRTLWWVAAIRMSWSIHSRWRRCLWAPEEARGRVALSGTSSTRCLPLRTPTRVRIAAMSPYKMLSSCSCRYLIARRGRRIRMRLRVTRRGIGGKSHTLERNSIRINQKLLLFRSYSGKFIKF